MITDSDFGKASNQCAYFIDWDNRLIVTQHPNEPEVMVGFNAAFKKAMDCVMSIEDGKFPNGSETLYLAVYQRYVARGMTPPDSIANPYWADFEF